MINLDFQKTRKWVFGLLTDINITGQHIYLVLYAGGAISLTKWRVDLNQIYVVRDQIPLPPSKKNLKSSYIQ